MPSLYCWIINWSHKNSKKIIINFILENIRQVLRNYLLACEYSTQNWSLPCMTMPKEIHRIYLRNTMPSLCSYIIQKHTFIVTRRCHFYSTFIIFFKKYFIFTWFSNHWNWGKEDFHGQCLRFKSQSFVKQRSHNRQCCDQHIVRLVNIGFWCVVVCMLNHKVLPYKALPQEGGKQESNSCSLFFVRPNRWFSLGIEDIICVWLLTQIKSGDGEV